MRAAVCDRVGGDLRFTLDHPEPVSGAGGLTIGVTACGVCHSDLHVVDGDFPSPLPMVLGHEVTGVHERLGPVMLYAPWGCRSCAQCAEGLEQICPDATEAGLFADGGYAERMWVPDERYLSPLDGLDPFTAAPLACGGLTAYRAVGHGLSVLRDRAAGRGEPPRALVIGAGGLGQYAIRYLRLLTDAEVVAVDSSPAKQAIAIELGAQAACGANDDPGTADLVLDFLGADSTMALAAASVRRRGLVAVVGLFVGAYRSALVPCPTRLGSSPVSGVPGPRWMSCWTWRATNLRSCMRSRSRACPRPRPHMIACEPATYRAASSWTRPNDQNLLN